LTHAYFQLDKFRGGPISAAELTSIDQRFAAARAARVKVVPRFSYNFPAGLPLVPGDEDSALAIVLRHIGQLEPILRRNADVIAFMEAGFIGAWGEWHHSTSGLDDVTAKRAILTRLLRALPNHRFVALRYQRDKTAIFGRSTPANFDEVVAGTDFGRVAHHNDCFLAAADDWGTYRPSDPASLARQKADLAVENEHSPQGGETCNAGSEAQPFIHCRTALPELARLHWSQLNARYHPQALKLWRDEGCYGEIARRLGYRLRLVRASFPRSAAAGSSIEGDIVIANDGFAAPFNARGVELVLRDRRSGSTTVLPLGLDPRSWASGREHRLPIGVRLPAALPAGLYELLLGLPDPAPALSRRPEYAIRLANWSTWEPETGRNRLLMKLDVGPPPR
ncbi:MAG: DUF4832 domain-containing protein, partial [Sphingomicrobium sp.]